MSDASEVRLLLNSLADRQLCLNVEGVEHHRALGVVSGETFQALDKVLAFAEELREQGYTPVSSSDRYASFEERTIKAEQRRVAELLEHTIRKALES
jgi:hypothetical protein